jgi:spermidine/putrescine-binding protein
MDPADIRAAVERILPVRKDIRTFNTSPIDLMAIPRDAPHPGNAHASINAMMDPAVVAPISNEAFYISANTAALPMMSRSLTDNPVVNVPDEVKRTLRAKPVLSKKVQRELTQALARFKAGR